MKIIWQNKWYFMRSSLRARMRMLISKRAKYVRSNVSAVYGRVWKMWHERYIL